LGKDPGVPRAYVWLKGHWGNIGVTMTAQLYLHEWVEGGLVTLRPDGELELATAAQLEEAVKRLCDEERRQVILDLSGVSFIDTVGVRAVLNCRQLFEERGCGLWLMGTTAPVRRVLEQCDLMDALPLHRDPAVAPGV